MDVKLTFFILVFVSLVNLYVDFLTNNLILLPTNFIDHNDINK